MVTPIQKKIKKPTKKQIQSFQNHILGWYEINQRELPRRDSINPYHILVAEVMLQQTQATRVIPKFLEFVREIPTINNLAYASQEKVLKLRSGLGFNRRALNLKKAAEIICNKYEGKVPDDPNILKTLPGIGTYTAASIPVFAYNKEIPVIDINIKRVIQTRIICNFDIEKYFNGKMLKENNIIENNKKTTFSLKYLSKICNLLIPKGKSRIWHNALMDYGSIVLSSNKTGISSPKQKPFSGSIRQIRGAILKKILINGPQDINELKKFFQHKDFDTIIQCLCNENFITITNGKLKIKE